MTTRPAGPRPIMAEQCTALSPTAVVAAAAPVAARLGAAAMTNGGNAYDAVLTAALAETVLLPPKCGLAGDLIALAWRQDEPSPEALLAIGGAPDALADALRDRSLGDTGPLSVGVPGAPAGYQALAERGRRGLAAAAAPAIELADEGFCWSRICTVLAEESAELVRTHQPSGTAYYPAGAPIAPGAVTRLPGLGRALQRLVDDGADFLDGPVGRAIVSRVRASGGILTSSDFRHSTAEWIDAHGGAEGEWWATPAPTHGPSLLDAMARWGSRADPAEVLVAVREAAGRRLAELADPSGTSMVGAVDDDGTMVVVVHSNSYPRFGSGLIVDEFDLILANRAGRGFSADPAHPNYPAPGRRPATTLHAWGWRHRSGTRVLGATPGGANQMPWNAQTIARVAHRHQLEPTYLADAVVAPRWQLEPTGTITIEDGFTDHELASLIARVPEASHCERWGLRSAMQIVADFGDRRFAVADPRTVGAVVPV